MNGMDKGSAIVLAAGGINQSRLPINTNASNAMIPVNGKPVIAWILEDLYEKGFHRVTVVLRDENQPLVDFLNRVYRNKFSLNMAAVDEGTIVDSLKAGLKHAVLDSPVHVVLGDTLITDEFGGDRDFVYLGEVEHSAPWCLARIDSNGRIQRFIEKIAGVTDCRTALAGYYYFRDSRYLKQIANEGGKELSDVIARYMKEYPVQGVIAKDWYDFGNIDNFIQAKRQLLRPRFFNSLRIDPVLNTISKTSSNAQKLEEELAWYQEIPDALKMLTPRTFGRRLKNNTLEIVQEYYGYPTLAELYVYSELEADCWKSILRSLLDVHDCFCKHKGELEQELIADFYQKKAENRLRALSNQGEFWQHLLTEPAIQLNGRPINGLGSNWFRVSAFVSKLARSDDVGVIHGDLCFSNILYDISNQIIRLVDPRGSFGRKGVYGDVKYDLAKLRHSISGLYDFIVADMFAVRLRGTEFELEIFGNDFSEELTAHFDELLRERGWDLREIRFLESLLFLSMVPLHDGKFERQLAMFLTGLQKLQEVFDEDLSRSGRYDLSHQTAARELRGFGAQSWGSSAPA